MNIVSLCDIDIEKCKQNRLVDVWGEIDNMWFDLEISKSLLLNGEVVGGYLLKNYSLILILKSLKICFEEGDISNLKFYLNEKELEVYNDKNGIYSNFIYIDKKYNKRNLSKYLIDHSIKIGDYVWGISDLNTTTDFWLKKQNRIIVATYKEELGESVITATKLK